LLVFAAFPKDSDHRYLYARWTGERWTVKPITAAGRSISEDAREPYYSGGLTLYHEDPRTVYVSRQVGEAAWEVETWTTPDGGDGWSVEASRPARTPRTSGPCRRAGCCRSPAT
jgi:hypothetical protein